MRIGRRLLIVPAGREVAPAPGMLPIRIRPGRAFGDGAHPTTRMCLAALEHVVTPGASMIDLGTGTGILAIAAAKLGAAGVLALDIDPEAVRVARENVAASGVAEQVRVEQGSLAEVLAARYGATQATLVAVNIFANVIVGFFADGLARVLAPGGRLVLSGFLRAQTPEIRACLRWNGLQQLAQEQEDDWACIIARRP